MKRAIIFITAVLLPVFAFAQAQINTKKVKIGDFTEKTTKVVLTGNMFYDGSLRDEIVARWNVSPYEFCTLSEFEELKSSDEYYFLLSTKGQFKKESEPGLMFLTLVKGGSKAEGGINDMLEIVSLPIASAEDPSGRETVFFPALLNIIQSYAVESTEKDISAYVGLGNYTINLPRTKDMTIIFSEGDLSPKVTEHEKSLHFDEKMIVTDEDSADCYMQEDSEHAAVSYVVAPTNAGNGSYCYKMLIDNRSHTVYYFKKHRITKNTGVGFLPEDIRKIASYRIKQVSPR